jgi:hypothetical protein
VFVSTMRPKNFAKSTILIGGIGSLDVGFSSF